MNIKVALYYEKPGVISPNRVAVALLSYRGGVYMYTSDTKIGALWELIKHRADDRYLAG